ncbi:MAG: S8 family serine peptidase, partial [bacterium]
RPTPSSAGAYRVANGSSAAAPLVSGLAGLVWSAFPFYSSKQVRERIRVTSDYIDDYNPSSYKNLLGHGLINAARAVDESFKAISVRADSIYFLSSANQKEIIGPEEEISVRAYFTNYLAEVDNITVTLTTTDSFVTMENSTFDTGPMNTMTTISNESHEFKFRVSDKAPKDHIVHFLLTYSNGTDYNDFQWTQVKITTTYYTHTNNNVTLTFTKKGTLGFNDFPYNQAGEGFKYKGSKNLMFEGALMYGTGPAKVMNAARIKDRQKQDFIYQAHARVDYYSSDESSVCFSDSGAGANALDIETYQRFSSIATAPDYNYIHFSCRFYNKTPQDIDNFYAGYFIDWNISENGFQQDIAYFDTTHNVALAYSSKNSATPYTAMALIDAGINWDLDSDRDIEYYSDPKVGFYAINNQAASGPVQLSDSNGFTDAEKWYALSNGLKQISMGPGDISYVISGGPYTVPADPFATLDLEFVIAGGSTLQEAIQAIKIARTRYAHGEGPDKQKPSVFRLYQNYPNPFNFLTTITYDVPRQSRVKIEIYDILGRKTATLVDKIKKTGRYHVIWSAKERAS